MSAVIAGFITGLLAGLDAGFGFGSPNVSKKAAAYSVLAGLGSSLKKADAESALTRVGSTNS